MGVQVYPDLPVVTDVDAADWFVLTRPSLGAGGSVRILPEDLERGLRSFVGGDPYIISGQMLTPQPGSAIILIAVPALDILIPTVGNLSTGKALVAATNDTILTIKKNGSTVGLMTIPAGTDLAAFTFGADVSLTAGSDVLSVENASSADPTLAGLGYSIVGRRV